MAMTAVNLDITLQPGAVSGSYVALAEVDVPGGASFGQSPMRLGESTLLGTVTLADLYRTDGPPATGQGASGFVQALVNLRDGFYQTADVDVVGRGLYNALPQEVRDLYNQTWGSVAGDATKLLRIRLRFDTPELARLPWEFMKVNDTFLIEHHRRSLIRFPRSGEALGQLQSPGKLKILIWAANPVGTDPLRFKDEAEQIGVALKTGLTAEANVVMRTGGSATDLLHDLQNGDYHVLHYIGHGAYDQASGAGVLEFDPGQGQPAAKVNALQLRQGIWNNNALRLVFLNACETAAGSAQNAYAALGFDLARFTPAVIAMQTLIEDDSAVFLAQEFYRAFSAGANPLDVCLNQARKALITQFPQRPMDWGIAALFSRAELDALAGPPVPFAPGFNMSAELFGRVRAVLLSSSEFQSNTNLLDFFGSSPRLSLYRDAGLIPQRDEPAQRVDAMLAVFGQRKLDGVPVLILIVEALRTRQVPGSSNYVDLDVLAHDLRAASGV